MQAPVLPSIEPSVTIPQSAPASLVAPLNASIARFEEFIKSSYFSGKLLLQKDVTKNQKVSSLVRLVAMCELKQIQELTSKAQQDRVMRQIKSLEVRDGSKYKYIQAVMEFLRYVATEESDGDGDAFVMVSKALERWDRAREGLQAGLMKDRIAKKKTDADEYESGEYPSVGQTSFSFI